MLFRRCLSQLEVEDGQSQKHEWPCCLPRYPGSFEELSQTLNGWYLRDAETKEATSNIINTRNASRAYTAFLSANLITASGLILMQIKGAERLELRMHDRDTNMRALQQVRVVKCHIKRHVRLKIIMYRFSIHKQLSLNACHDDLYFKNGSRFYWGELNGSRFYWGKAKCD